MIVQVVGKTTRLLCRKRPGDVLADVLGPLGNPTPLVAGARAACVAGGVGTAELPDYSGRRRPVLVPGSEWVLPVETVIEAVGQRSSPVIQATTPALRAGERGTVAVDGEQRTSRPGVFAGGDLARGGAAVILAMRDGRRAAAEIHAFLEGGAGAPERAAVTAGGAA